MSASHGCCNQFAAPSGIAALTRFPCAIDYSFFSLVSLLFNLHPHTTTTSCTRPLTQRHGSCRCQYQNTNLAISPLSVSPALSQAVCLPAFKKALHLWELGYLAIISIILSFSFFLFLSNLSLFPRPLLYPEFPLLQNTHPYLPTKPPNPNNGCPAARSHPASNLGLGLRPGPRVRVHHPYGRFLALFPLTTALEILPGCWRDWQRRGLGASPPLEDGPRGRW